MGSGVVRAEVVTSASAAPQLEVRAVDDTGAWVLVRNPGPGLRRLDTFERFTLPQPMRPPIPRFLPPGAAVSLSPSDAARALGAGMVRG